MNKTNFKPPRNKNDLTNLFSSLIENKRVSVFIDGANLYFATGVAKLRIDYDQIKKWISERAELTGLNYYTAFDPEDKKQDEFLVELDKKGYRIIKKPIKVYENLIKGNMDIELAVDALLHKDRYDILILISGDGDFTYLIDALERDGKKIIVLGIGGFTSYELHQRANNYFFLNRIARVWQAPKKVKTTLTQAEKDRLAAVQKKHGNSVKPKAEENNKEPKIVPVKLRVKKPAKPEPKIFLA